MAIATVVGTSSGTSWLGWAMAAAMVAILAVSLPKVRGTTLKAPLLWALAAGIGLAVVEAFLGAQAADFSPLSASIFRYAAAVGTLCPLMAVLGAKRPQDRGWQWVVISLWIVLMLPAMQAALLSSGRQLDLFVAWRFFLAVMIGLGLLNYLPTRFWLAAVLVAGGQILLLDNHRLWSTPLVATQASVPLGIICLLAAVAVVRVQLRCSRVAPPGLAPELEHLDQQWLQFRNAFGVFWALRILQRVNQTAETYHWPVRLTWLGFLAEKDMSASSMSSEQIAQVDQTMQSLLRRFISSETAA